MPVFAVVTLAASSRILRERLCGVPLRFPTPLEAILCAPLAAAHWLSGATRIWAAAPLVAVLGARSLVEAVRTRRELRARLGA